MTKSQEKPKLGSYRAQQDKMTHEGWLHGSGFLTAQYAITSRYMCIGRATDTLLARVVQIFGSAQPHHAYRFANARGSRMKVLVNDGFGLWLVARRLHQGRFVWPAPTAEGRLVLSRAQFDALVLGLPWQRVGDGGVISLV